MGHAVAVAEAAPGHVALRVVCFGGDTGGVLADTAGDNFDLDIGIDFVEAGDQSFQVELRHGGVEDQRTADFFLIGGIGRHGQSEGHAQREDQCQYFFHAFFFSLF